ncbi:MAG: hypothetical protein ABW252_13040 [Polyangiales bacterium]
MSTTKHIYVVAALALGCGASSSADDEAPTTQRPIATVEAGSTATGAPDAGTSGATASSFETTAAKLAAALTQACPLADAADARARERCADALGSSEALRSLMTVSLRWGGQTAGAGVDPAKNQTTHFSPFVWRRMYLSTFMFTGEHRVSTEGARQVVHVPVTFRNQLDAGDYPYPFWHSEKKWTSYQQTRELLFVFEQGAVALVLRSTDNDTARPLSPRVFTEFKWQSERGVEPRNTLYSALFARDNPHVAALEAAYRGFEETQRKVACVGCHDPSNKGGGNPLEMLSYPNQSLSGRHNIVTQLELNDMPPGVGIPDEDYRQELLARARTFAEAGDRALAFERERTDI